MIPGRWFAFIELALGAALVAACSSSGGVTTPPATMETGVCPATPAEAIGAACNVDGLVCSPEYTCGITSVTVTCTCSSGRFACVDFSAAPIADGGTLPCPDAGEANTCPTNVATADGTTCTEIGLSCAYPSTCEAAPEYETCQCALGQLADGTMGLRFGCSDPCSPPFDAGTVDAAVPSDASTDATLGGPDASHDASMATDASDASQGFDAADATDAHDPDSGD